MLLHPLKFLLLMFFFRLPKKHLLSAYSVPTTVINDRSFMMERYDAVSALKEFNFFSFQKMQSLLSSCEHRGVKGFQFLFDNQEPQPLGSLCSMPTFISLYGMGFSRLAAAEIVQGMRHGNGKNGV